MDIVRYLSRCDFASVGKAVVLLGIVTCFYQLYSKWKRKRAIKKLAGKVVLITGASSGLGEALSRAFHSVGAKLILASRNAQQLERLKFQLENERAPDQSSGTKRYSPQILTLDLCEPSLAEQADRAIQLFGRVDILINNAGISSRGGVVETDIGVDRKLMEVNFFGPVTLTKALLPHMLSQKEGHIVVISSLQGKLGLPMRSSYSASKHALHGYFDSMRTELSVNALRGDGAKHGVMDATTAQGMCPDFVAERILEAVALKQRELVIASPHHHLALCLATVAPGLMDRILQFSRRT
ncbi:hypothetical protein EMCRGX_G027510 [Ephydatia muelleri]